MIELSDVTFNIPVKIDCQERLENLKLIIDYISYHFNTNIIIYEVAKQTPHFHNVNRNSNIKYIFEAIGDRPFHRTRYLNDMALMSHTPIIVNYDCDVIFESKNYTLAYNCITKHDFSACFPYDGLFLNIQRKHIPQICEKYDLSFIDTTKTENFGNNSMGGAIFWKKSHFIKGGMENENFISWGYEDWERVNRFNKLGFKVARVPGPLYHISHPRGVDSSDGNPYYHHNGKTYDEIMKLNTEDLQIYINKQPWMEIFT